MGFSKQSIVSGRTPALANSSWEKRVSELPGAIRRVHLLLELACRTHRSATGYPDRYNCPLTQTELADALGLSAVHVSRVLKTLREAGLASFRSGVVELHDYAGLIDLGGFDRSYI